MSMKRNLITLAGMTLLLSLSGCTAINDFLDTKRSVDYSKSESVKKLEVPPDLTAPEYDSEFDLPVSGTVSVAAIQSDTRLTNSQTGLAVTNRPAMQLRSDSTASFSGARTGDLSSIRTYAGQAVLQIHDTHQRALIMTDIILERMGFSMLERNVAQGAFRVQYNGEEIRDESERKGLLKRMFSFVNNRKRVLSKGAILLVNVRQVDGQSLLSVTDVKGKPLPANQNTALISRLNNEFNR